MSDELNCSELLSSHFIAVVFDHPRSGVVHVYTVFQKSDAKIQITVTTAYHIRIKYYLNGFNYHNSDVNVATYNKIHRKVSEQQLF